MAKKIGLKGFSAFGIFPEITDTATAYTAAGTKLEFVGASSCSVSDNREDFEIPGDDGVYDSGSEWSSTDVEVTVHEAELAQIATLAGCTIDEAKAAIEEGVFDIPANVAMVYRALRRDGGYRCYRYYNCKLKSYTVNHSTKGSSNDGQAYTFKFSCLPRAVDGMIRGTADVASAAESLTWLASIPNVTADTGE